jgi:hypothetical protein
MRVAGQRRGQGGMVAGPGVWQRWGRAFRTGGVLLVWAILFWAVSGALGAVTPGTPEEFRALYLYNFARYTEWPEGSLAGAGKTFRIGVLGSKSMVQAAQKMLRGTSIKQLDLKIEPLEPGKDLGQFRKELSQFQMLFIAAEEEPGKIPRILADLGTNAVLTVMEIDPAEFEASNVGMVNFEKEPGKLNFVINQTAGERAGLKFDPRLLNLAKKVYKNATARPPGAAEARSDASPTGRFVKSTP